MDSVTPFVSNVLGKDSNDYYEIRSFVRSGEIVNLLDSLSPLKGIIAIKNLSYTGNLELSIKAYQGGSHIVKIIPSNPENNTLIITFSNIEEITIRFLQESFIYWGQFGYKLYLQESGPSDIK